MYTKKYILKMVEEFNRHNPLYDNVNGCVCYPAYLKPGERGWLLVEYMREDEWLTYPHRLHTSVIKSVVYADEQIIITTENTRLTLEVVG